MDKRGLFSVVRCLGILRRESKQPFLWICRQVCFTPSRIDLHPIPDGKAHWWFISIIFRQILYIQRTARAEILVFSASKKMSFPFIRLLPHGRNRFEAI